MKPRPSIYSQSPAKLAAFVAELGQPKFRGKQLVKWIFEDRVFDVDAMSNLPAGLRQRLAEAFDWSLPEVSNRIDSEDGASKLLLSTADGYQVEAVVLRYENRTSLCVSSQVGCKLACSFCQTGKLGFFRHLEASEIVAQFVLASNLVRDEGRRITHIVFMGMGEPLDNFGATVQAVSLFTGDGGDAISGYGISPRRVTISTSGVAKRIPELATACRASLAISLHAARDEIRSELMPINRRYDLAALKSALLDYQKATGDMITFEYILIRDKTCSIRNAKDLVRFLHGIRAKVNLIPFNAHPGIDYEAPSADDIRAFQKYLAERSIPAPVRYSKGSEVSAACGQLAAKTQGSLHLRPERARVISPV